MDKRSIAKRTLVSVVGLAAAIGLMTSTPLEESGRVVAAAPRADTSIALQHIRGREYLTAYADVVGVWTICDGLTAGVKRGQVETRAGCAGRLEAELVRHADEILACVPELRAPGRDHQRWAFTSLAYKMGAPKICASTAARRYRAGQRAAACDAFGMWVKAGRPLKTLRGLVLRRERERQICLTGLPGRPEYAASTLTARLGAVK